MAAGVSWGMQATGALSLWLGWTAAMNLPFLPATLGPLESYGWPIALLAGIIALAIGMAVRVFARSGRTMRLAAVALAAVLVALIIRLTMIAQEIPPLALVGLREIMGIFAVVYLAFAMLSTERTAA